MKKQYTSTYRHGLVKRAEFKYLRSSHISNFCGNAVPLLNNFPIPLFSKWDHRLFPEIHWIGLQVTNVEGIPIILGH